MSSCSAKKPNLTRRSKRVETSKDEHNSEWIELWVCSSLINVSALKIGQTIGYSLILGFSLFGNSIIGLTVYKTPKLRKPINYLIANMAISDMLLPFFTIPLRLSAEIHSGGSWPTGGLLGQALCKLAIYFTHVSFGVSSQSLVLIALDHYVAVVFPLQLFEMAVNSNNGKIY